MGEMLGVLFMLTGGVVMALGVWRLIGALRELWRWTTEQRADGRRYRGWVTPAHGVVVKGNDKKGGADAHT